MTSNAMQSLVDLAPTFLKFAGVPIPGAMTGKDQSEVWLGQQKQARNHIICEFHHEPTTVNLRTYVNDRYKITVYCNQEYGEMFDLFEDPNEIRNLWDSPEHRDVKSRLLLAFMWSELDKDPMWMPRIAGA